MRLSHEPLDLELADTFTIARDSLSTVGNRLVRISCEHQGRELQGIGECAPHSYLGVTTQRIVAELDALLGDDALLGEDPFAHSLIEARLRHAVPDCPPVRAGIEAALLDLTGKILGQPLWRVWGLDPGTCPPTSFTIGIAELDYMVEKARRAKRAGHSLLKIKLGTDQDLDMARAIVDATGCRLRVDANCAWSPDQAIAIGRELQELGVEFIEQPIPAGDLDGLRRVTEALDVPVIADESIKTLRDVAAHVGCVDGVNIKLTKCGGLLEATRMIHAARALDMRVMLGCNIESSVGISTAAQLAPLLDHADLDGQLLLAEDPYRGVQVDGDRLILPRDPGIGALAA